MNMKKRAVKICVSILVFLLVAIGIVIGGLVFAFSYERNKRPDDDISKAIYEAVGRKKAYYYGKEYFRSGKVAMYAYVVRDYEDEKLLTNIVEAANAVLKEKEVTQKIQLAIWEEMSGGSETVVSLYNYYDGVDGYEQYTALQNLYISGTNRSIKGDASPYNKASTYINLPDIKRLVVSKKIAQNAEEEGIDWYEVWSDLEYYEVLED